MLRYSPLILAFVAVGGVAVYDGLLNNRWTPNELAEAYSQMLSQTPSKIGPWVGKDYEVDDDILRTAGAEGYVSRAYVNEETNEVVKVWLIVGPFKHVVRHTPDICYPSNDFRQAEEIKEYSFDVDGIQNQFVTSIFEKHGQGERVYWSWLLPPESGELEWYASPDHHVVREHYAGSPALFKLYFTVGAASSDDDAAGTVANDFAKEFLPIINNMVEQQRSGAVAPAAPEAAA